MIVNFNDMIIICNNQQLKFKLVWYPQENIRQWYWWILIHCNILFYLFGNVGSGNGQVTSYKKLVVS